jgi:hypothetical protein
MSGDVKFYSGVMREKCRCEQIFCHGEKYLIRFEVIGQR